MGPSGSGKTTLLNLVGGLDRPTEGGVTVQGDRIDRLSRGRLAAWRSRHVGLVFQFYNLLPVLSAERNIELPLLLTSLSRSQRREHVETALSVVGTDTSQEALPARALRRRAAARRYRARHRHRSDASSLRRADRRSRSKVGRRDSRSSTGPEPRARQDHRDGHPRSSRRVAERVARST